MARVVVDVMLKPEILDPQGQAVASALPRLGVAGVSSVRIGKRIEIEFLNRVDEIIVFHKLGRDQIARIVDIQLERVKQLLADKRIEIEFTGEPDLDQARQIADKLLANPVIEDFTVRIEDVAGASR